MKFLVPNCSCLQNPWLGGYRPQISVLSVLNWMCWNPQPEQNAWVRHCKEVTDTFLFCLILFASYAFGILGSYADIFLYMPHAHSYHICSTFTVWDPRLWRLVLLHPRKVLCAVFRYVVNSWNFTDRQSISTPSCFSQNYCLVLQTEVFHYHIIFGGVTRWNWLKPAGAAHTLHCEVLLTWMGEILVLHIGIC